MMFVSLTPITRAIWLLSLLENLLHSEFFEYRDSRTGARAISANQYHVPENIHEYIDYITPGICLPLLKKQDGKNRKAKDSQRKRAMATRSSANGTGCDTLVTPKCISTLYKIPSISTTPSTNNSLGIFEGDQYGQADLGDFYTMFSEYGIPNGTAPLLGSIDGGNISGDPQWVLGESNLDLQVAYPIIYPQNITLYQTDDIQEMTSTGLFNTFLDAATVSISPLIPEALPPRKRALQPHHQYLHLLSITLLTSVLPQGSQDL